ncbi:MAG: hypothetical protein U0L23_09310 [Lachnospiraceae bacterium]|nr:hypothetical protein [Lachnospiraceae bacterium]
MARPKKAEAGFRKSFFFWNEVQYDLCSTFLKLLKKREDTGNIEELDRYTIKDVRGIMEADKAKAVKRAELRRQLAELDKEV